MSDFDVEAVLSGTVEEISAKLGDYTPEQRKLLHDAEKDKGDAARVTLLDAIHRVDEAAPPATPPAAPPPEQKQPDPAATAKEKAPAKSNKAPAKAPAPRRPRSSRAADSDRDALKIDPEAGDLKLALEYHEAALVGMTDSDGKPIAGWPPLEFPASAFAPAPAGVVLTEAIDMEIGLPRGDVCAVWLVVGGKPMAVARLAVPLAAGGGRRASFPKGSLRFRTDG